MAQYNRQPSSLEFSTKILGLRSTNGVATVALDLDLWSFGPTDEEAVESLRKNIELQIAFTLFKEQIDLFPHAAPTEYFDIFNECRFDYFQDKQLADRFVTSLPYPSTANIKFTTLTTDTCYHSLVSTLQQYDERFEGYENRSRPAEKVLYHPSIDRSAEAYSFLCTDQYGEIVNKQMEPIKRRFRLPDGLFDHEHDINH